MDERPKTPTWGRRAETDGMPDLSESLRITSLETQAPEEPSSKTDAANEPRATPVAVSSKIDATNEPRATPVAVSSKTDCTNFSFATPIAVPALDKSTTTKQNKRDAAEDPDEDEEFTVVKKRKNKTRISDLAATTLPTKEEVKEAIDFATATKLVPPEMPHVEGYIASLADCRTMIAVVREDGKNILVRLPRSAAIIAENKSMEVATARIGHKIRLYHVQEGQLEMKRQPTLSSIQYYSRLFSVFGRTSEATPTIAIVAKVEGAATIVSAHTPNGVTTHQPVMERGKRVVIREGTVGAMLLADAYEVPSGMKQIKKLDCDVYIREVRAKRRAEKTKEASEPKTFALANLRRLESEQIRNIQEKCNNIDRPTAKELELWVGRATAALAAYHTFTSNVDVATATVREKMQFRFHQKWFGTWEMENARISDVVNEKFKTGETIEAQFGSQASVVYKITAKLTRVVPSAKSTKFTVAFSTTDAEFVAKWANHPENQDREVGLSPIKSKEKTHETILEKFVQLPATAIGRQMLGRATGQHHQTVISDEKRQLGSIKLDDSQTTTLTRTVGSKGISIVIAPPGSGQTALVAAITREWISNGKCSRVIITGPTNVSVGNALEVLQESIPAEDIRPMRIASAAAIAGATEEEQRLMSWHQARHFEEFIVKEDHKTDLGDLRAKWEEAREEAGQAEEVDDIVKKYGVEREASVELTKKFEFHYNANVVAITTALLLRAYNDDKGADRVTRMIVDEASMLRPSDLLALLCKFRNLEALILIGDTAQLSPYLPVSESSDLFASFAQSDMERLHKLRPQESARLTTVYRGHPDITKQLVAPNYPFELQSGTTASQRCLAQQLRLPRAESGSPIQFVNVNGREQNGVNRVEAEAISQFVKRLLKSGLQTEQLLVLVHHKNQSALLQTMLSSCTVKTIDAAQGQQAPVVIVATTKTARGIDTVVRDKMRFVSNSNRATVAVSRAKEAVYIFGAIDQLEKTAFWEPLVRIARENGGITGGPMASTKRRAAEGWRTSENQEASKRRN